MSIKAFIQNFRLFTQELGAKAKSLGTKISPTAVANLAVDNYAHLQSIFQKLKTEAPPSIPQTTEPLKVEALPGTEASLGLSSRAFSQQLSHNTELLFSRKEGASSLTDLDRVEKSQFMRSRSLTDLKPELTNEQLNDKLRDYYIYKTESEQYRLNEAQQIKVASLAASFQEVTLTSGNLQTLLTFTQDYFPSLKEPIAQLYLPQINRAISFVSSLGQGAVDFYLSGNVLSGILVVANALGLEYSPTFKATSTEEAKIAWECSASLFTPSNLLSFISGVPYGIASSAVTFASCIEQKLPQEEKPSTLKLVMSTVTKALAVIQTLTPNFSHWLSQGLQKAASLVQGFDLIYSLYQNFKQEVDAGGQSLWQEASRLALKGQELLTRAWDSLTAGAEKVATTVEELAKVAWQNLPSWPDLQRAAQELGSDLQGALEKLSLTLPLSQVAPRDSYRFIEEEEAANMAWLAMGPPESLLI